MEGPDQRNRHTGQRQHQSTCSSHGNRCLNSTNQAPRHHCHARLAPALQARYCAGKWSVEGIELDLSQSKVLDARLPAKVAFEFLALCTGEAICSNDWPLPELRRILATGIGEDDTILRVEHFRAGDPRPFHGICIEENPMNAQVQVRLFGCLAYCVHFPQLYIGGPRYAYTHCLETRHEDVSIIGGEALSR